MARATLCTAATVAAVVIGSAGTATGMPLLPDLTPHKEYRVTTQPGKNAFGDPNWSVNGRVSIDGGGSSATGNTTIGAGLFRLQADDVPSSGSKYDFLAFCLEVLSFFTAPKEYKVTGTPFSQDGQTLSSTQRTDINRLWNGAFSQVTNATTAAAMQLSLWEIVYEGGSSYSVTEGDFRIYSGFNEATRTQANTWLGFLNDNTFSDTSQAVAYLERIGTGGQNLVTVIPLPAGVVLLGSGLIVLMRLGRRPAAA
jgi:hypothetical protein